MAGRDGETRRNVTAQGFSALASGTRLDNRYTIESVIAAGGFGITYLGRHNALGKVVAIKEHFPRHFAYRDGTTSEVRPTEPETFNWALDRFLQEGRALATCKHPHVVDVTDVVEANGTAYMVLGFEDGRSLEDWLTALGRRPTQAEIDRLLAPLLEALAHVHAHAILHRDIKPSNIMVRGDGRPCLIDFGAARQAIAGRSQLTGIVTPGFSPPEQHDPSGRGQREASDIYALAATLYQALTGITPPSGALRGAYDELKAIREALGTPARIADYRAGFLDGIDAGLRVRIAERPQSVAAWRGQLFGASGGQPHSADPMARNARTPAAPARPVSAAQSQPMSAIAPGAAIQGGQTQGADPIARGPVAQPSAPAKPARSRAGLISAATVAALAFIGGATWWGMQGTRFDPAVQKAENERRIAEANAGRLRAEAESERRIAEANAGRLKAEAEARRLAEERAEREKQARAEAALAEARKRDAVASLAPGSGKFAKDRLADGSECSFCPEMVVAPAGSFMMGSPDDNPGRAVDEGPVRRVTFARPFAVGRFAVTFAEWDACVANGGCDGHRPADQGWGRGDLPVVDMSWNDTRNYVSWLSRKTGKPYRLLSEAEREYVTRAGTTTDFWWGSAITTAQANYDGTAPLQGGGTKGEYRRRTLLVNSFQPNPWGLFQVHGNVWEWVEDCWHENYKNAPIDGSAWNTACTDANHYVLRGGSWFSIPRFTRATYRSRASIVSRHSTHGFRVARTLEGAPGQRTDADRKIVAPPPQLALATASARQTASGVPANDASRKADLDACDRFAASPEDATRPSAVPGVPFDQLDVEPAIAACKAAFDVAPDNPRVRFQLARALAKAGREATAVYWHYRAAAEAGHAAAMNNLGQSYDSGRGVEQDHAKAREWYAKAAARGIAAGMHNLGVIYGDGRGVTIDNAQALMWFERAATAGTGASMRAVAGYHLEGLGVPKDIGKAREWLAKAVVAGDPVAVEELKKLDAASAKVEADAQAERAAAEARQKAAAECQAALRTVVREGVINFKRASAEIDPASLPTLNKVAETAKRCPEFAIEIEGHTDSDGTPERNQALSERRASAILQHLVSAGLAGNKLEARGYGETRPVAPNDTAEDKAKNRRIEFTLK